MRYTLFGLIALSLSVATLAGTASAQSQRRILVYGDSNTWGYVARRDGAATTRFDRSVRWPGVLAQTLGETVEVVEDGLNLRTTNLDGDAWGVIRPDTVNGATHLPVAVAANLPLDMVVIMLGTNDLQARYDRSPDEIAQATFAVAEQVKASAGGIGSAYPAPSVLVVSPPRMAAPPLEDWNRKYAGGVEKSRTLAEAFQHRSRLSGIPMIDAAAIIGGEAHGEDGLHLTPEDHRRLGRAVAERVGTLLDASTRTGSPRLCETD